ncbi:Type IV secretion system protein PtlF precursor [Pigmentiphaga humi]|uniref:Type IV secretion system protein PtlF n=1 Tax=Pigmentiphaga humi TaxID=2478468 RepID=A0A3P4B5L4_9BURK|nr:P-type conjugative transfer protein TrbG [Pigmentiphaga humi]MBN9477699.1 P-type conjugative transfer protein TrbG [Burkholderiales bacterium]ODU92824.1 MAG: P-type conjugative transfer protein TrbG [Bordetella sp. SCN 68-11]OJW94144.1 MAG: P-type conjugative transfer protein TrbG [Burkholderiales bacterium 67-32]VCU71567.1 Type IV secretion system protein PtlF precursor [Pigmentiphaga humi]
MKSSIPTLVVLATLAGCASRGTPPPEIALDVPPVAHSEPVALPEPPKAVEIVPMPQLLPLPGQLKPVAPSPPVPAPTPEPADPAARIAQANQEARMAPSRDGFINAIQTWPYSEGALYQVYASPGRVTLIQLQPGEKLIDVSAGDTVRWIVGDSSSGSGATTRANLQVKPIRAGLKTNLIVTTDRRIYLLELASTESAWMASVSWDYPQDRMAELKKRNEEAQTSTPLDAGVTVEQLRFRYDITGDTPPWRPLRAFDDGQKVYIQFPAGIAQGELPPLFLVGPSGDLQLVNHQYRAPYYVVDRLFGAVELRLGGDDAKIVRISRDDVATARGGS